MAQLPQGFVGGRLGLSRALERGGPGQYGNFDIILTCFVYFLRHIPRAPCDVLHACRVAYEYGLSGCLRVRFVLTVAPLAGLGLPRRCYYGHLVDLLDSDWMLDWCLHSNVMTGIFNSTLSGTDYVLKLRHALVYLTRA